MSSRLFVEVRERRGLAYWIDAGETSYSDAGLWTDRVAVLARGADRDPVRRPRGDRRASPRTGSTGEELARAKGQLRGQTSSATKDPTRGWAGSAAAP